MAPGTDPPPLLPGLSPTLTPTLDEAEEQGLSFTKGLLVVETIGAMEEETQIWWKSIVEMEADQRIPSAPKADGSKG